MSLYLIDIIMTACGVDYSELCFDLEEMNLGDGSSGAFTFVPGYKPCISISRNAQNAGDTLILIGLILHEIGHYKDYKRFGLNLFQLLLEFLPGWLERRANRYAVSHIDLVMQEMELRSLRAQIATLSGT